MPQGALVVLTPLTGPHACLSQPNIINKLLIAAQLQYSGSPRVALCLYTSVPHRSALSGDEPGVVAVAVPQRNSPEPQNPPSPPRHGTQRVLPTALRSAAASGNQVDTPGVRSQPSRALILNRRRMPHIYTHHLIHAIRFRLALCFHAEFTPTAEGQGDRPLVQYEACRNKEKPTKILGLMFE